MPEDDGKVETSTFDWSRAPSREGLTMDEVWFWDVDRKHWMVAVLNPDVDPNAGGSPSPVGDGLEENKTGD